MAATRPLPSSAVFLDAGGVLHLPRHAPVIAALRRVGVRARSVDLDRAHYIAIAAQDGSPDDDRWQTYQLAYARAVGAPEGLLATAGGAIDAALADPEVWRRPIVGVRTALRALVKRGSIIVVVSNADGTVARRLADGRICQVGVGRGIEVACVLDSTVVGVSKPDARIFEMALEAAGMPRDRVLHVGDSIRYDVRGAEAAGIRGVHFDPLRLCQDRTHEHLVELRQLPGLVGER